MFYNDFNIGTPVKKQYLYLIMFVGVMFFIPLFYFRGVGSFDFWWWMSANQVVLISLAFVFDKSYKPYLKIDYNEQLVRKFWIGVYSAAALYGVFFIGNYLSKILFDFASEGVNNIYDFKSGIPVERVFILMVLIIGPGEEIFWRGFVQRNLSVRFGNGAGFIVATVLYAGVHIASGNFMLVMAALICGLFWGWMYMRFKSVILNIVSHTIWDVAVFIMFPFT